MKIMTEILKDNHRGKRNDNECFASDDSASDNIRFKLFDKERDADVTHSLGKLISTSFRRSNFRFICFEVIGNIHEEVRG